MMKPPLLFYYGARPIVAYLRESLERLSTPTLVHAPSQTKSYRGDAGWSRSAAACGINLTLNGYQIRDIGTTLIGRRLTSDNLLLTV